VAVVAVVSGFVWNVVVTVPSYLLDDTFRASIPESELAQMAASDVYFTFVGAVAGLVLGATAWILFRHLEWVVTIIAILGAIIAWYITSLVGEFIGPRRFEERIAQADPGELVRMDFTAHTWVPLVVWIGMAVVPVLVGSLFRREKWFTHVSGTPEVSENPEIHLG
jgi:hypothetical protein